jgi:hypothetical protein
LAQANLDIPNVVDHAQQVYGDHYAGMWVDNSAAQPVVNIMIAGAATTNSESQFRSHLTPTVNASTKVTNVKYPYARLQAFQQTIADYVQANYGPTTISSTGSFTVFLDTVDNAVGVALTHEDAGLLTPLQALVPTDALRVKWVPAGTTSNANGPGWVAGDGFATFPPYKAGLAVENHAAGNLCTTSFTLEVNGNYKGTSAGHCSNPGDNLYDAYGNYMATAGPVHQWGLGGDYDVFGMAQLAEGTILAETSPSYYGFIDDVIGRQANAYQGFGLNMCFAGVTTNIVNCGYLIYGAGAIVYTDGRWVSNLACANVLVHPGDSGGAAYVPYPGNEGKAAGVIDDVNNTFNFSCYTTIDAVLQGITNYSGYPAYVVNYDGSLS